jgi:branched-chain amino acid transport system substrate-binding protein
MHLKGVLDQGGYGQALLDDSTELQAAQGATVESYAEPVELHTHATEAFQAALSKYEHVSGIPNGGTYQGWIAMDAIIAGLKAAGSNPTKASFITAMRKITNYTAGGLLASPTNFSVFGNGDPSADGAKCWYAAKVTGSTFAPVNNGKPVCGTIIPGTNQS